LSGGEPIDTRRLGDRQELDLRPRERANVVAGHGGHRRRRRQAVLRLQRDKDLLPANIIEPALHRQATERILHPRGTPGRELEDGSSDVVVGFRDGLRRFAAGTLHVHMVWNGTDVPR
jgi:hypothetical protein